MFHRPFQFNSSTKDDNDFEIKSKDDSNYEEFIFELCSHYDFKKRICVGPNASVYKAIQKNEQKEVVIKIAKLEEENEVPRDVRLLFQAQYHPNICEIINYHRSKDGKFYAHTINFIKEDDYVTKLFGNPEKIKKYIKDMIEATAHLHEKKIIYRDMKFSNFLWNDQENKGILIDFDCSSFYNEQNGHFTETGTDGFLCELDIMKKRKPDEKGYDLKVDSYSIGMCLGALLNEHEEADVADPDMKQSKPKKYISKAKRNKSKPEYDLLLKLLENDPEKRISCKDAVKHKYFEGIKN